MVPFLSGTHSVQLFDTLKTSRVGYFPVTLRPLTAADFLSICAGMGVSLPPLNQQPLFAAR